MVLLFVDYCLRQRYQESLGDRHSLVRDAAGDGEGAWREGGEEEEVEGHVVQMVQMADQARRIDRNPIKHYT